MIIFIIIIIINITVLIIVVIIIITIIIIIGYIISMHYHHHYSYPHHLTPFHLIIIIIAAIYDPISFVRSIVHISAVIYRCDSSALLHISFPFASPYIPVTVINVRDIRLLSNITFSNSTTTTTVCCCEARTGHYESESNRRSKS